LNGGVKDPDYPIGPAGIEIVVIASQPGRIGRRTTDLDRDVGDASRGVAAGVIENVILELARVVHNIAKEGKRVGGGGNSCAADINTVEVVVRCSACVIPDAND
jgi:hypothetical protein